MVCTWPKLTLSVSRAGVRWIRPPTFGRQWSTECEQQYPLCVKGYLAIPEKVFFRCGRQSCPSRETIFRWFWKHLAALDGPNLPLKRTLVQSTSPLLAGMLCNKSHDDGVVDCMLQLIAAKADLSSKNVSVGPVQAGRKILFWRGCAPAKSLCWRCVTIPHCKCLKS